MRARVQVERGSVKADCCMVETLSAGDKSVQSFGVHVTSSCLHMAAYRNTVAACTSEIGSEEIQAEKAT